LWLSPLLMHLVADGLGVAQDGALLVGFGTSKHAADRPVEQTDVVVGQAKLARYGLAPSGLCPFWAFPP